MTYHEKILAEYRELSKKFPRKPCPEGTEEEMKEGEEKYMEFLKTSPNKFFLYEAPSNISHKKYSEKEYTSSLKFTNRQKWIFFKFRLKNRFKEVKKYCGSLLSKLNMV